MAFNISAVSETDMLNTNFDTMRRELKERLTDLNEMIMR